MSPPLRGPGRDKMSPAQFKPIIFNKNLTKDRKKDCSLIYPGDHIYIPDDPSCHFRAHQVKTGESLWRVARRFKSDAKFLCSLDENQHLRITGALDPFSDLPQLPDKTKN